ncbi:MAG: adenylate/guanylate cyclase domain-containing protein, partial [Gallionellaceae bacterium]|nr:adenylate/guanylate cyclase domain-containing protein [Gallionellaceae bacterium]
MKKITSGQGMKVASFLLACLSIFLVISLYFTQNAFLETFEAKTYDLRFSAMRGPLVPSPEIVIIAIDEKSIAELGRYPWTRSEYARLINKLSEVGAKAILFDAFFPEHESTKPDQAFAVAAKKAGNVYLATAFDFDPSFKIRGRTGSIPEIENAVKGVAHINFFPENDGVNRRSKVLIENEGKFTPSLGVAGAMVALGKTQLTPEQFVNELQIPVSESAMWVNFMGPAGIYPRYSFADVAAGRIAPELLKDKIVFVGATALGVYDMRVTPFDGNTPGVETHAAIADNILSGRFIRQSGLEAMIDMAFIVLMGGLAYFLTTRLRLYSALPAVLVLVAGYVWLSYQFFLQGHWISMVYPPMAALTAVMLGGGFRFLVLERSARKMRAMFSSYLSDKLVARLEKDPDAAKLGGANKEVTVLFTDIKGFTTYSEGHTPQEVVARLNEYLGEMVQIVELHDGTVDKFIGDGIMVYWGAPLEQPNHAELAIECIRAMKKKMIELRAKWAKEGVEPFYIRGGLQSGVVVAGNVGFEGKKMEYTVIGDTVNQSARLEGTAKYYGVSFLVGENTYEKVASMGHFRELDRIRVVGKQLPVRIYEMAGFS